MEKLIVTGGHKLQGITHVSGAKNVALKALVAATLTPDEVVIDNIPLISDVLVMVDLVKELGGQVTVRNHTITVRMPEFRKLDISLDEAARVRTSFMFIAPLLARAHKAIIPNPGGCRLGARPVDRLVDGLRQLNSDIVYDSEDGFYYATTDGLKGTEFTFQKSTHTGTETMIIAAVMARGKTIIRNAAEEPEIDELIELLNRMGGKVKRVEPRVIEIEGVQSLHGAEYRIKPDRNEIVTLAIAAYVTRGDVVIREAKKDQIKEFLEKLDEAGAKYEETPEGIRFNSNGELKATNVTTKPYPGFMTDWQAPWAVLMTQAKGISIIHETVFENKMGYAHDLLKMGAKIELFNPKVENPEDVYNFNLEDDSPEYFHAIKITGPTKLHNAIVQSLDIRAGAAVVLAALAAKGETTIHGVDKINRGYENFDARLNKLGASVRRVEEDIYE